MPKEIVAIGEDPKLNLIKAYRTANKRAGEAKRRGPEGLQDYLQFIAVIRNLKSQATEMGFQIWTMQGKTGHTYEKDYKVTPDDQNNYEMFQAWRAERDRLRIQLAQNQAAITTETQEQPPEDNLIDPTMISDED